VCIVTCPRQSQHRNESDQHSLVSLSAFSEIEREEEGSPLRFLTSFKFGTDQTLAPPLQLPVASIDPSGENRIVEIGRESPIWDPRS
jgi:hypothetical protein